MEFLEIEMAHFVFRRTLARLDSGSVPSSHRKSLSFYNSKFRWALMTASYYFFTLLQNMSKIYGIDALVWVFKKLTETCKLHSVFQTFIFLFRYLITSVSIVVGKPFKKFSLFLEHITFTQSVSVTRHKPMLILSYHCRILELNLKQYALLRNKV